MTLPENCENSRRRLLVAFQCEKATQLFEVFGIGYILISNSPISTLAFADGVKQAGPHCTDIAVHISAISSCDKPCTSCNVTTSLWGSDSFSMAAFNFLAARPD